MFSKELDLSQYTQIFIDEVYLDIADDNHPNHAEWESLIERFDNLEERVNALNDFAKDNQIVTGYELRLDGANDREHARVEPLFLDRIHKTLEAAKAAAEKIAKKNARARICLSKSYLPVGRVQKSG